MQATAGAERVRREKESKAERKTDTAYLVLWWLDQTPYVARLRDEIEADAVARVRNATVIEVRGLGIEVPRVMDYYRRDQGGRPMPAKWKDLEENPPNQRLLGFRAPA